jgi:hypothetical protein
MLVGPRYFKEQSPPQVASCAEIPTLQQVYSPQMWKFRNYPACALRDFPQLGGILTRASEGDCSECGHDDIKRLTGRVGNRFSMNINNRVCAELRVALVIDFLMKLAMTGSFHRNGLLRNTRYANDALSLCISGFMNQLCVDGTRVPTKIMKLFADL